MRDPSSSAQHQSASSSSATSGGVREALIAANPTWHRNYDEDGDPYISMHTDAEAVDIILGVLSDRPDLLIRLAVETRALTFYSICSKHQTPDQDCDLCKTGSLGVTADEGGWVRASDEAPAESR